MVVRYVADDRSENAIRHAFDMRLPRWEPGNPHWLCLVMREKSRGHSVGVTGLIDRSDGVAEVGVLLASAFLLEMAPTPSRQEAGYTTGDDEVIPNTSDDNEPAQSTDGACRCCCAPILLRE